MNLPCVAGGNLMKHQVGFISSFGMQISHTSGFPYPHRMPRLSGIVSNLQNINMQICMCVLKFVKPTDFQYAPAYLCTGNYWFSFHPHLQTCFLRTVRIESQSEGILFKQGQNAGYSHQTRTWDVLL